MIGWNQAVGSPGGPSPGRQPPVCSPGEPKSLGADLCVKGSLRPAGCGRQALDTSSADWLAGESSEPWLGLAGRTSPWTFGNFGNGLVAYVGAGSCLRTERGCARRPVALQPVGRPGRRGAPNGGAITIPTTSMTAGCVGNSIVPSRGPRFRRGLLRRLWPKYPGRSYKRRWGPRRPSSLCFCFD